MAAKKKTSLTSGEPPKAVIGREEILRKYWELANLDPEVTKGTITGQLKALDSLAEELGLIESARESPHCDPPGIYRSAWMSPAGPAANRRTGGQ